jgi:hypothetical protein
MLLTVLFAVFCLPVLFSFSFLVSALLLFSGQHDSCSASSTYNVLIVYTCVCIILIVCTCILYTSNFLLFV